jgi:Tol biopolymer transport system component
MPELKEVFEMVTKQTEPEIDSWREQERRQRRTTRNRRIGAFALVAAIGALATVIAIDVMRADETERTGREPDRIPDDATHVVFDLETGTVTSLPASLAGGFTYAVSPDGARFAYSPWPDPIDGDVRLLMYVANVDGSAVRRVVEKWTFAVDQINPRWTPSGQIVYQRRDDFGEEVGDLYLIDPATGSETRLTDLPEQSSHHWFMSHSVHPDGQTILFNMPRRGPNDQASLNDQTWDLWTIPSTGGELTLVRRNAAHGSYSPTGTTIVYLARPGLDGGDFGARSIWLSDADGSDPRRLVEGTNISWPRWSPDGTRIAYEDDGGVYVVDVGTGEASRVIDGGAPEWLDDDTLIVGRG